MKRYGCAANPMLIPPEYSGDVIGISCTLISFWLRFRALLTVHKAQAVTPDRTGTSPLPPLPHRYCSVNSVPRRPYRFSLPPPHSPVQGTGSARFNSPAALPNKMIETGPFFRPTRVDRPIREQMVRRSNYCLVLALITK